MSDFETAKTLFFAALDLIDARDFQGAELRLREALQLAPGHANVLTNLSLVLLQQDRPGDAREYARQAIAASPKNIEALLVLAGSCVRIERFAEALDAYDKVISLDPTVAEAYNNRGLVLEKLGRLADALESFERAIKLDPGFSAAHVNRGNTLEDPDQALAAYEKALTLDPDLALAWLGRGNVFCEFKRSDEGLANYDKALALNVDLAEAWLGRGNALRDLKRHDEALAAFDQALARKPDFAEAWFGRGNVFLDLKRHNEAVAAYDKALTMNASLHYVWFARGGALSGLKRVQEAIAAYREAVRLGADAGLVDFYLAGLGGEALPSAPPERFIVNLFDSYADNFDRDLVGNLKYRTPVLLAETIKRFVPPTPLDILDMGCGTGLMGERLRRMKRTLTGVDLSPNMLEKARQRDIYDQLVDADLVKFLEAQHQAFDLAVAADVFVYVGDLSPVFSAVRKALRDGGLFCFSVEAIETGDFVLRNTLRYAHSIDYLRKLAGQNQFAVESIDAQVIRQDSGKDIGGYHAVMRLAS
jgi:predicted TPR repeat methyltransferase